MKLNDDMQFEKFEGGFVFKDDECNFDTELYEVKNNFTTRSCTLLDKMSNLKISL
jgi:hypothetical protein